MRTQLTPTEARSKIVEFNRFHMKVQGYCPEYNGNIKKDLEIAMDACCFAMWKSDNPKKAEFEKWLANFRSIEVVDL